jgi:class 3 adenylate cyclase
MVASWRPIEPARSRRSWSTAGSSSIMAARFVKLIGDGALAEFASVVDAVECD